MAISIPRSLRRLVKQYNLTELELSRQVSDQHIEKFSRSHGSSWKSIPSHLGLKTIIAEDIDHSPKSEPEKRHAFFSTWKHVQGSFATYKALINALLVIESRQDAESVCEMVQDYATTERDVQV